MVSNLHASELDARKQPSMNEYGHHLGTQQSEDGPVPGKTESLESKPESVGNVPRGQSQ
jgi:hypothetical protein